MPAEIPQVKKETKAFSLGAFNELPYYLQHAIDKTSPEKKSCDVTSCHCSERMELRKMCCLLKTKNINQSKFATQADAAKIG
jgi:hypothetical protein